MSALIFLLLSVIFGVGTFIAYCRNNLSAWVLILGVIALSFDIGAMALLLGAS